MILIDYYKILQNHNYYYGSSLIDRLVDFLFLILYSIYLYSDSITFVPAS